jgi:signal peptidase I
MKSGIQTDPKGAPEREGSAGSNAPQPDNWRETIESIVVAFVLAFLFRTFEAEAFVIPTGSMAPTLYGQHRDVYCSKCGTRFAVGVNSLPSPDAEIRDGMIVPLYRSHFAICPNANCRFPNDVLEDEMFAGDRILVNKFPYEFGDPQRWDVVVFKFPEQAKTNYIKRLVGLPGEKLKIVGGNIMVKPSGTDDPYHIARKSPEKQRELQLLVHDNDSPARELLATGWPEAWAPQGQTAWAVDAKARSFRVDADSADPDQLHWLRYTHYVPTSADWSRALAGKPALSPVPQKVMDYYAYNSRITVKEADDALRRGELPDLYSPSTDPDQWVGDLTVNCEVELLAAGGELVFELIEGQRTYQCTVDLTTGRAKFSYVHDMDRDRNYLQDAGDPFETGLNKPGRYAVSFANVDDRLCFWVDDRLAKSLNFEPDEQYRYQPQMTPVHATDRDTAPVGIGAKSARLRISHLIVERDIYYRNDPGGGRMDEDRVYELKDDVDDDGQDEFLMLGDNSPRSNDSRLWQTTHAVPRHLLIGKAFFVYWPHGVPFLNNGKGYPVGKYYEPRPRAGGETNPPLPKFSVPFYPQVGRMHRIR